MVPHPAFAPLVSFASFGRSCRWFEEAISRHRISLKLDKIEVTTSHEVFVNWNKVWGLATLLVVCGGGWTAAGIAATHFFK
jgi:hypothetical protein